MTDLVDAPSGPLREDACAARRDASVGRASALLAGAMFLATMSNYVVNVVLAGWMDPAAFGDATLIVTLMLIITVAALTLQLATARAVSTSPVVAAGHQRLLGRAWAIGAGVGIVLAASSGLLREVTASASSVPFIVLAAGLPLYLAQAVERGVLQGRLRFGALATTFVAEAIARTLLTIGLVAAGLGVTGAALGLSGSFAVSWFVARRATLSSAPPPGFGAPNRDERHSDDGRSGIAAASTVLLVGQIVINNGDVVLAKALFDADAAGHYAVAALVGRAVFFLSWSVVTAAFPHASSGNRAVVGQAVRAVGAISVVLTIAVTISAPLLVPAVFGDAYRPAISLLGPYAVATSLFAVANVMATLDVATGRKRGSAAIAGGAVLQMALLLGFADDGASMVRLQIVAMTVLVIVVWLMTRPLRAEES